MLQGSLRQHDPAFAPVMVECSGHRPCRRTDFIGHPQIEGKIYFPPNLTVDLETNTFFPELPFQ